MMEGARIAAGPAMADACQAPKSQPEPMMEPRPVNISDQGLIRGTVAQVNAEKLGYTLTVITEVEVENERLDLLDDMKKAFLACPQVQQCFYVAGECDFVLIMLVKNMEQYTQLTRELLFESNNVKRFKTLVSMSNVKTGMFVPTSD